VRLTADKPLQTGVFYNARIVDADEHDLAAVEVP
jgi:hypothetical protein